MEVTYTPIPVICSGRIMNFMPDTESYEVFIHKSPNDSLMSNIRATAVHHPGLVGNYKKGDYVKVSMMFNFENGMQNKFIGPCNHGTSHIIGLYDERSVLNVKVENPLTAHDESTLSFLHKDNGSGLTIEKNGTVRTATGSIYSLLKSFGYGIAKDLHQTVAQNHTKIISNSSPNYLSREHFGMYSGASLEDQSQRTEDSDYPIVFRRFVAQTLDGDKWVSSCEGSYAPWFGPNNNSDTISKSKEVLFTKIINNDKSRITLEMGEADSFFNLRIDDVKSAEKIVPTGNHGASPALLGNRFSMIIDESGAVDIRAAGKGAPSTDSNLHGFHMSINADGDLKIYAKGKISLSHSEADEDNNSIVLDPKKGIDITAKNGLRVNGDNLVNNKFIDWFDKNKTALCVVTAVGAPAPLNPAAATGFVTGTTSMAGSVAFTTKKSGSAASGKIKDTVKFSSV